MKPLIIGEAPSKNEHPPTPIEGRIGRRLAAYAGLTFLEFLERFDRINLLSVRQDTREKGFEFDRRAAIDAARTLMPDIESRVVVLLLGKRVANAVGCVKDYFEPHVLPRGTMYVLPHPSGINRWHNDPENRKRMEKFMRTLAVSEK